MKYDYGDDVVFKIKDQIGTITAKSGTVVGITPVENVEQSKAFKHPLGTILYTVEFGDGTDALLSEELLAPLEAEL